MTSTFAPSVTATVRLQELRDDGVLVTTLGTGDVITVTIYMRSGSLVGATYSSSTGEIVGDGAGTWIAHIVTPSQPGQYYVQWNIQVGAHVGIETYTFQVRTRTG